MRNHARPRRLVVSVLAGIITAVLVVLVPRTVGTTWSTVGGVLGRVSAASLLGLAVVWIAGLWAHSFVLAASLPGLTRRRALMLSLSGSAVANVLPLGGAVGTGLNFAMISRWEFSPAAFATFLTVTQLLNVVAKLGVVAAALALTPVLHTATALPASRIGLLLVPVLAALALVAWLLSSAPVAARLGRRLDRLAAVVRRGRRSALELSLPALRRSILAVVGAGWRPMGLGMLGYLVLQAVLLWLCFTVLGTSLALPALLTVLAVERLLTLVVITPGGAGVVEVGGIAALVALGNDPAVASAGLLLFRGFTYLLEIPVGGTILSGWLVRNRRRADPGPLPVEVRVKAAA